MYSTVAAEVVGQSGHMLNQLAIYFTLTAQWINYFLNEAHYNKLHPHSLAH